MMAFRTKRSFRVATTAFAAAAAFVLLISGAEAQRSFETAEKAASALADSIKSNNKLDIIRVLGRGRRQRCASPPAVHHRV
jgi:hypothetical protein